jgi:O-antigen ligase
MAHNWRGFSESLLFCLTGVFFGLVGTGAFIGAHMPASTAAALLALAIVAFARPIAGLLIFLACAPIAVPLSRFVAPDIDGQLFAELLLLACLSGALVHFGLVKTSRRVLTTAEALAVLLIVLAATSAVASMGPEYIRSSNGESAAAWAWHLLVRDYFDGPGALRPLYDGMLLVESLVLFMAFGIAAGEEVNARSGVWVLVIGAAAAAAFNLNELRHVFTRAGSLREMASAATGVRISVDTRDVNAAGSYFAMAFMPAVAAIRSRPIAGIVLAMLIGAGEALAGSRTAFVATTVVAAAVAVRFALTRRSTLGRGIVLAAIAVFALAAVPAWKYLAHRETNTSAASAMSYRMGMWQKAFEMTRDHPLFGIGVGEFAAASPRYEPTTGPFGVPENAHNEFFQIMAELGVPGLLTFVAILFAALVHKYEDRLTAATFLGVLAFLLSALGGHPLLIRTVAYPFWGALGLTNIDVRRRQRPKALVAVIAAAAIVLALVIPWRWTHAIDAADFEHVGMGVSRWMTDRSGAEYRVASSCASVYVPTRARRIEIGLRPHSDAASIEVELWESRRVLNRIELQGRQWTTAVLTGGMPDARERRFSALSFRVYQNGSALPCSSPALDVRKVLALP